MAFKKVVIETKRTWTLLFEEVPQHALSEKIIPALASLVGSSGTVHELAQEEAEALFQTDEAHKNRMRSRADGVADTPRMQNFMEYAGAFHGSVGKAKKKAPYGRQNGSLCGTSSKSSVSGLQRVETSKLRK